MLVLHLAIEVGIGDIGGLDVTNHGQQATGEKSTMQKLIPGMSYTLAPCNCVLREGFGNMD